MKKFLLIIAVFLLSGFFSSQAQTLYGSTFAGGMFGGGAIIQLQASTDSLSAVTSFQNIDKYPYYLQLLQATDGKLYGTSSQGGPSGYGSLFSYDTTTGSYNELVGLGGSSLNGVIQATDGKLYGTAGNSIFSYDITYKKFTVVVDLTNYTARYPSGKLVQATNGLLYGVSSAGGPNNTGVLFSFNPVTHSYSELKYFTDANEQPDGPTGIMQASNGLIYGLTVNGGSSGGGTIFSYDIQKDTIIKLKDLTDTGGFYPQGSLMQANDGNLYGMTEEGSSNGFTGVIFSYNIAAATYTKLKDLDSASGINPYGNLLQGTDGKLYGLTSTAGAYNYGTLFSFDLIAKSFTVLVNFDKVNGANPWGSVIQATSGKLYGATFFGGKVNDGVLFSYDLSGHSYQNLFNFGTNVNGYQPAGQFVFANDRKLYGMTIMGGANNQGILYSFDPYTFAFQKLKDFDSSGGYNPFGHLTQAGNGIFYGMTLNGGLNNNGVIFSFDAGTKQYAKLLDFNGTNGANPYGSLTLANDGKLYGMTSAGGNTNNGVIFSLDPITLSYVKLQDFNDSNGGKPHGNLIQGTNGKLYGLTTIGGPQYLYDGNYLTAGVLFSFDITNAAYAPLQFFNFATGGNPFGSLVQATNGLLYGMNSDGDNNAAFGNIFSYNITTDTYTVIRALGNSDGTNPEGSFIQSANGKLYGAANSGGHLVNGTIFSLNPSDNEFIKTNDFNVSNGADPYIGFAFTEVPDAGALPVTLISFAGKRLGGANQLTWKVANVQNIRYYELQRSTDGQAFIAVSQISSNAVNGNYIYNDYLTGNTLPVYYYRLKSVDNNGEFAYSNTVVLSTNGNAAMITLFPNPANALINIQLPKAITGGALISITSQQGEILKQDVVMAGTNIISINIQQFAAGVYNVNISFGNIKQTLRFIKQ